MTSGRIIFLTKMMSLLGGINNTTRDQWSQMYGKVWCTTYQIKCLACTIILNMLCKLIPLILDTKHNTVLHCIWSLIPVCKCKTPCLYFVFDLLYCFAHFIYKLQLFKYGWNKDNQSINISLYIWISMFLMRLYIIDLWVQDKSLKISKGVYRISNKNRKHKGQKKINKTVVDRKLLL
jgi:hypothetical protein